MWSVYPVAVYANLRVVFLCLAFYKNEFATPSIGDSQSTLRSSIRRLDREFYRILPPRCLGLAKRLRAMFVSGRVMIERRELPRYELAFPICVGVPTLKSGSGYLGRTRDISSKGVHFILKHALAPGDAIAFAITLPAALIGRAHVFVRCHGRVLWVDGCDETGFGIAAAIEKYKISKECC